MNARLRSVVTPAVLAVCAAALYLPRLQDAPIYPQRDEMYFALTAHSVAFSGRDPSGLFMPVYFPIGPLDRPLMWFQPMLMYAIALVVRVLPFTESSIRLPMAAAGIVDVVLIYFVAKLLFERELLAIAAAVLLALAPAHFVFSRFALDYLAPVPFILGWLLCLLRYCRRGQPLQLFTAGLLLGFGLYTYIAANILMPFYALLTCDVLYRRRDPAARYVVLAAGFLLPAMAAVLFLARHPAILRDVVLRYQPNQPQGIGLMSTVRTFIRSRHLSAAASVYGTFWNPQLLFIDGRAMLTGVAGVFLLPVAGALVVGIVRAVRHVNVISVLLLGGLLSAPLPASFVDKPEVIRRALEVLPFVVLLAVYGLDFLWSAASVRAGRLAFLAIWTVVICLIEVYWDHLPHAQAYVRALTVPVGITGLATLLCAMTIDRLQVGRVALAALISLTIIQIAYSIAAYGIVLFATVVLMGVIGFTTVLRAAAVVGRARISRLAAIGLLALVASEFVYFYVDYPVRRIGLIPASAQLLAIRFVCAGAVTIAAIGLASAVERVVRNGLSRTQLVVVASVMLVAIQLAYFHIDYFSDYRARYLHVAAVTLAVTALAMLLRGVAVARLRVGQFAIVALMGIASVQFKYFYADYFAGYRIRRSSEIEGNVRVAYETLLERSRSRQVPAVYLSQKMEFASLRDLYWRFYLLKHDRPDLLPRTINAESFEGLDGAALQKLPPGAIVVASASRDADAAVDRLASAGRLEWNALVRAVDGVPIFWILEKSGDGR